MAETELSAERKTWKQTSRRRTRPARPHDAKKKPAGHHFRDIQPLAWILPYYRGLCHQVSPRLAFQKREHSVQLVIENSGISKWIREIIGKRVNFLARVVVVGKRIETKRVVSIRCRLVREGIKPFRVSRAPRSGRIGGRQEVAESTEWTSAATRRFVSKGIKTFFFATSHFRNTRDHAAQCPHQSSGDASASGVSFDALGNSSSHIRWSCGLKGSERIVIVVRAERVVSERIVVVTSRFRSRRVPERIVIVVRAERVVSEWIVVVTSRFRSRRVPERIVIVVRSERVVSEWIVVVTSRFRSWRLSERIVIIGRSERVIVCRRGCIPEWIVVIHGWFRSWRLSERIVIIGRSERVVVCRRGCFPEWIVFVSGRFRSWRLSERIVIIGRSERVVVCRRGCFPKWIVFVHGRFRSWRLSERIVIIGRSERVVVCRRGGFAKWIVFIHGRFRSWRLSERIVIIGRSERVIVCRRRCFPEWIVFVSGRFRSWRLSERIVIVGRSERVVVCRRGGFAKWIVFVSGRFRSWRLSERIVIVGRSERVIVCRRRCFPEWIVFVHGRFWSWRLSERIVNIRRSERVIVCRRGCFPEWIVFVHGRFRSWRLSERIVNIRRSERIVVCRRGCLPEWIIVCGSSEWIVIIHWCRRCRGCCSRLFGRIRRFHRERVIFVFFFLRNDRRASCFWIARWSSQQCSFLLGPLQTLIPHPCSLGLLPAVFNSSLGAMVFDCEANRPLHSLQGTSNIEHLVGGRDFDPGTLAKIRLGFVRPSGGRVDQTSVVVDSRIFESLLDRRRQVLVRVFIVVRVIRMDSASIEIAQSRPLSQ
jgi:hypothetical protein